MKSAAFLTKSLFQTGTVCPTRIYYETRPGYTNTDALDPFLSSLAEGGYQVEALARLRYPKGIRIESKTQDESIARVRTLLAEGSDYVLFEAPIAAHHCLARADILRREGNRLVLSEIKAKTVSNPAEHSFFQPTKKSQPIRRIRPDWMPYLVDAAFQRWVLKKAFSGFQIETEIILLDGSARAPIDGMNQLFKIGKDVPSEARAALTGQELLCSFRIDEELDFIEANEFLAYGGFSAMIETLSRAHREQEKLKRPIGSYCRTCPYPQGFKECWTEQAGFKEADFERPHLFELWNFRKHDQLIARKKFFLEDLEREDIDSDAIDRTEAPESGLKASDRRWLQVEKVQNKDSSSYIDVDGLRAEISKWVYPLHFIDFETTSVALPFHKGMRPYQTIAFQFSHHVMHETGEIEHRSQFLLTEPGKYPNKEFAHALRQSLGRDLNGGSVFRYAHHENSVLLSILESTPEDLELCEWIRTITEKDIRGGLGWTGPRSMIDLFELVKRFSYQPATRGSNSIKNILPAILNDSIELQQKYSLPIYGGDSRLDAGAIPSLNFKDQVWIKRNERGLAVSPYQLLDGISDGGEALRAYAELQFADLSASKRDQINRSLLRYCELDTFAMALIVEYWRIKAQIT